MHGYNADNIKNWSPETDKHAKYLRSRVPLAERIPSFSATQANPKLSAEPQVMNLSADYDKENTSFKYNDTYCCNLLRFWQYTDLYGAWHGLPVDGSPANVPVYGTINLPNPAYTDAAHRNGVLSLGCWFWPREEEDFSDLVEQKSDGSFPVADKMMEMALYFGFDGYFINQEAPISESNAHKLMEMMTYLRNKAPSYFHFQWYDTVLLNGQLRYQNQFNDQNTPWIIDESGSPVMDSMFINYAWNDDRLTRSHKLARELDLDPYRSLFASTENDKYGYNPPYDTRLIFPENQTPRTGWALFGTDFVWNRYQNKFDTDDQEEVYKRERRYWSGPLEDPTDRIGRTLYKPFKDPFHAVDREEYRKWDGVGHYIPERSVIGSSPFITRFNTGHGKAFFLKGKKASEQEWNNASIQDILPSWQWWIQRFDSTHQPINETKPVSERPLVPTYDYHTVYEGGTSLKVSGKLEPEVMTELRLFKSKVLVTEDVTLSLTYKTGYQDAQSHMEAGLIFEDDPNNFIWLAIGNSVSAGWNTQTFSLKAYEGRTIATIGLRFSSTVESDYEINIGELALINQSFEKPAEPTGFTVDEAHFASDTAAELFLSWDFKTEGVWYYDISRIKPDGEKELIGRIYDEVYYVKLFNRANNEHNSTLELTAVGMDGSISNGVTTTLTWPV